MANDIVLSFENLGKQFGTHWAIREATAELCKNDYIALVGPNGAGKTSLLRLLCRVYRPSEGRITYANHFWGSSFYFSTQAMLYASLTAYENLRFYLQLYKRPHLNLEPLLEYCGLGGQGNRKVENFSTGMLQRLNVAALLAVKPRYVFFDEPFNGLDSAGQKLVNELLSQHGDRQMKVAFDAFVVVDHNLARVRSLTQKQWQVQQGHLSKAGATSRSIAEK